MIRLETLAGSIRLARAIRSSVSLITGNPDSPLNTATLIVRNTMNLPRNSLPVASDKQRSRSSEVLSDLTGPASEVRLFCH